MLGIASGHLRFNSFRCFEMIRGWNHFSPTPKIEEADRPFWDNFLKHNLDRITTVLANIPNDLICIVCGNESLQYANRSRLANHIRNHAIRTCNYWFDNIISKSPEELESILLEGNTKGVFDI